VAGRGHVVAQLKAEGGLSTRGACSKRLKPSHHY